MKKQNQQKVWEKIALKWNEFKNTPSPTVKRFLKRKNGKILDLGSGSGRNFPMFSKKSEIYAIDFSGKMLKYAKQKAKKLGLKIKTFESDTIQLPIEDNYFDSGICIAVLHCIETKTKRQKTIKELFRVLKPGAEALISVWSRKSPRLRNKPKETFVPWTSAGVEKRYTYIYDKDELEKDLKDIGFQIINSWEERNINMIVRK